MVFESIVVDLLNKFLGDYVQNLDSSQLKLGIWGGDAILQNLILKENALNELDLPVKTTSGSLGKLVLKIPWKNLYNAPVVASIENLQLLVVPNTDVKYDAEKEEKIAWDTKQQLIKKLEEAKRIEEERKKPRDPQQDTFTEKLITQVIKNLQINIKDIHVRYEDKLSHAGNPFAFGITLHNLTFESTDENWKVGLVQDANVKMIYKLITMNNCAFYWNSKTKLFGDMNERERNSAFINGISTDSYKPPNLRTVLGPINSTLKLQLNPKPEQTSPDLSIPKVLVTFVMDELAFAISKYQYQDILILSQSLEWMTISSRYRKHRPNVPLKGHAKEWWLFAYNCILEEDVKRKAENWSWSHIKAHRQRYRDYKEAYTQVLLGKRTSNDNLLQNLEKELDIFNISLIRKQADLEFERSGLKKAETSSGGWFGGWFSKKKEKKEDQSLVKQFEDAMTAEEKAKLCEAIGYHETMVPTVYPKHFVENKLRFELKRLKIAIVDDSKLNTSEIVKVLLNNVVSGLEQRPAAQAIKICANVGALTVFGYKSDPQSETPTMVSTQAADKKASKMNLLDVLFETNPLEGDCDQRLHVKSNPLEIVYHADTINNLASVFKPPKDVEIYSKLQLAASSTLAGFKEYSATNFQYAIDMHKYLDLKLDLRGPYLIIPEKGVYKKNIPIILVDMGNLKMLSVKRNQDEKGGSAVSRLSRQGVSQDEIMKEMMSQIYDKYTLSFSGIQILLASVGDDWMSARGEPRSSLHIWQPTNISIQIDKSVILDDPRISKLKVQGSLPHLHFNLSDVKVLCLAKLILSIPTPEDSGEESDMDQLQEPLRLEASTNVSRYRSTLTLKEVEVEEKQPSTPPDPQSTNLEFSFEIGEVSLIISKLKDDHDVEFMKFSVNKLGIGMKLRTYDTLVNVYLGEIGLENREYVAPNGDPVYLIQTPSSKVKSLCSVQYIMANKTSPIFKSTYNSVIQQLTITFASLDVLLHQEAILSSVKFARDLQSQLEKISSNQHPLRRRLSRRGSTKSTDSTAKSDRNVSIDKKQARHTSKRLVDDVIDIKIIAQLEKLSIGISSSVRKVLDVHIEGIEADVSVQKSMTSVHNILRKINIIDPTPNAVHSQIISAIGKEVIDTKIVLYNFATVGKNYLDMEKCDTSIEAKLGKIRIFFVNKVVTDLLNFASNFQVAVEKVKEATVKAAEVAMENVQLAFEKASRISLQINMIAPEIIMPRNSKSMEVILLDMGQLKISNKFLIGKSGLQVSGLPPILEDLSIQLQKFKMSRALWEKSQQIKSEVLLLKPITIVINIMRNLSASWCIDIPQLDVKGKLGSVIVSMSQEDYSNIMNTLNENLNEQPETDLRDIDITMMELSLPEPPLKEVAVVKRDLPTVTEDDETSPTQDVPYTNLKFDFTLDKLSVTLYLGSSNLLTVNKEKLKKVVTFVSKDPVKLQRMKKNQMVKTVMNKKDTGVVERHSSQSLATIELQVIALKGEILSDKSIWANVVLVNCILDDIRENRNTCITRLMERISADSHDMVDVTFRKEANNDLFLDVKVFSFNLVACPDYLMTVSSFFTSGKAETQTKEVAKSTSVPTETVVKEQLQPPTFSTTIVLHVEKPDIILVDDVSNINSEAIILNNEISFRIKMTPERQTMSGTIAGLQILSCCFNPDIRTDTQNEILSPCEINISSNMPFGEGMHMDIDVSIIELHLTPGTVRLLTSISNKLAAPKVTAVEESDAKAIDCSDLWNTKKITDFNFWYLKPDVAEEAVEDTRRMSAGEPRSEQMIVKAKIILVTLEIGIGNQTMPMLLLESGFFANMQNWSSALELSGGVTLEMLCYNDKLALWEPFIERVETPKGGIRPWELVIEIHTEPDNGPNAALPEPESEEMVFEAPRTTLLVKSADVMELVITKTSLEVLTNLGQAFGEAVNLESVTKIEPALAPYVIENFTGFSVTIVLKHQDFVSGDWAIFLKDVNKTTKVSGKNTEEITEVILEPNTTVPLSFSLSADQVSKKSVLKMQEMSNDRKLIVKIKEMNAVRQMSVKKADKRLFPLPQKTYPGDQWGLVCDVRAVYGCKIISLRSVVQVKNEFSIAIEVYYVEPEKDELVCCGIAEPNKFLNIPLKAVYTTTNEFFFRPKNDTHKFSLSSYVWKDLVKNPIFHKIVECESKDPDKRSLFIHVVGEIDQVYFEDSKKKTLASTCYILHLKPTVILKNFLPVTLYCGIQGGSEEHCIIPGEKIELFWADLNNTILALRIKDYLDQEWICSRKLNTKIDELSVWSFETLGMQKSILDLGVYTENDLNSMSMSIYCPFWMINKTGLTLAYKADETNITVHPNERTEPILFSFRAKHFFTRKKACLKIQETDWSEKFSIDVVGSSGTVKCHSKDGSNFEVGVEIRLSSFKLSKIVIFTPFYLLTNHCEYDVECSENQLVDWIVVPAGECVPFWPKQTKQNEMKIKVKDFPETSNVFMYNDSHSTLLVLKNKFGGIHVECQVNEACVVLSFTPYKHGMSTVRLVNSLSNCSISFHQSGEKSNYVLGANETQFYTWDNPLGKREIIWSCTTKEYKDDLVKDGIGEFRIAEELSGYWVSFLDDTQRTLLFTDDISIATRSQYASEFERVDQEINISLQGFGISLLDNVNHREVLYVSIASSGVVWEACKEKGRRFKPLSVDMSQALEIGYHSYLHALKTEKSVSQKLILENKIEVDYQSGKMFKPNKRKIRRSFQTGLWIMYKTSPHRLQLHVKINRIQIDNQMPDCIFPVVLFPVPPPKTVAAESEPKPFMELSIMMRKSEHSTIQQYQYFKVLIQEFHIKIDQAFISGILTLFTVEDKKQDEKQFFDIDVESLQIDLKSIALNQVGQEKENFYDLLHFSPLKVHVSFSNQGCAQDGKKSNNLQTNFLNVFVQSVGVTLTEIQDVVFKLAYFERQHKFMSQKQLTGGVITHYCGQAIKQMYVLVLGLDVIGNPFGLVIGLTQGVEDLFYEPIQGAIQGPEEFAEGLALGVKSLFGHAVGGAAGAVSRITGTLGKGVAALTLDEDYQRKRREAQLKRSANFQEGMAQSGKGLVLGVFDGVTGVFVKPIAGAKEEGVEGFFKGVGKGVVGLVTRPTAGVIDFASGTLDSVKRIAESSTETQRCRPPRFFQSDNVVRPYNKHEAEGNKLLQDVEKGKFATTDIYMAHACTSSDGKIVILITDKRLVMVSRGDIFGQWNCDWQLPWDDIKGQPKASDKGVLIPLKEPKKKVLGLFGSGENSRFIPTRNAEVAEWIIGKIQESMAVQI